jgi:hypothetical protein
VDIVRTGETSFEISEGKFDNSHIWLWVTQMSLVHCCTLHPLSNQMEFNVELNATALAKFEIEATLSAIDCSYMSVCVP